MSSKHRFERAEGSSSKFWEIWREGDLVYTRFGRIGSIGQTTSKAAPSEAIADKVIARLNLEKTRKGYVESAGPAPAALPALDRAQLAQHLANLPGLVDDGAFLVLADWLQSQGHPWGELIAVQHAIAHAPEDQRVALAAAEAEVLAAHGPSLLGAAFLREGSRHVWHHGFLRTATISTSVPADDWNLQTERVVAEIEALLARPLAHLVEGLILDPVPQELSTVIDWDHFAHETWAPFLQTLEALARCIPARIRHLGFGSPAAATAYVQMPDFEKLSALFPALRRLEISGHYREAPSALSLRELVDLEVRFAAADERGLAAIAASQLPKLERLSLWLGGHAECSLSDYHAASAYDGDPDDRDDEDDEDDEDSESSRFTRADLASLDVYDVSTDLTAAQLARFLAGAFSDHLTHLGLCSAVLDERTVQAVVASPLIRRLRTLDLSGGTLDDGASRALIAAREVLSRLDGIDVSNNRLTEAGAERLAEALPNVRIGRQRTTQEPAFFARYVPTYE